MSVWDRPNTSSKENLWSSSLARALIDQMRPGSVTKVTWLNHYTAVQSISSGLNMGCFDHIGIDGTFLRLLLGKALPRTSADLVLPFLLDELGSCRIGLVGSTDSALARASRVICDRWPRVQVAWALNGYDNCPSPTDLIGLPPVDLAIIGLGSPLQDSFVINVPSSNEQAMLVVTCGGWIDQISEPSYYPPWAYPLHLNWLVRVMKEPRRLWRRYTSDALVAWKKRQRLRSVISSTTGLYRTANSSIQYAGDRST